MKETILNNSRILAPEEKALYIFLIAAVWGDEGKMVAEINRYWGTDKWPSNMERKTFVFENGVWRPDPHSHSCIQTDILLGRELQYMLTTPNFNFYLSSPPHLGNLEPATSRIG